MQFVLGYKCICLQYEYISSLLCPYSCKITSGCRADCWIPLIGKYNLIKYIKKILWSLDVPAPHILLFFTRIPQITKRKKYQKSLQQQQRTLSNRIVAESCFYSFAQTNQANNDLMFIVSDIFFYYVVFFFFWGRWDVWYQW